MRKCSVLIVDDFEAFRRCVREMLQRKLGFQIVGETSDGFEAVRQASQLQPDLVLLDLALPSLNGISVARRLRDLTPRTKIVFISMESCADVIREALKLSDGYVDKIAIASELLPAIEAVMKDGRFLSSRIKLSLATTSGDARNPSQHPGLRPNHNHEVAFYVDDSGFVSGMSRFIEATLYSGGVVIAITTDPHRSRIVEKLQSRGLNVSDAMRDGSYVSVDSLDALSLFMVNDWPDAIRFSKVVDDLMYVTAKSAREHGRRVAACGELAPILWAQRKRNAAIQVEHLWDEVARTHGVDTLCGYLSPDLHRDRYLREFNSICNAHTAVYFR